MKTPRKTPPETGQRKRVPKSNTIRGIPKVFPVVGVGASAGGLEAFTRLLEHLPVDTGMAFVLVQHLDPAHESALASLLARVTLMPVREVTNDLRVKPNHVYVIPPNTSLAIRQGVLKLQPRRQSGSAHLTIDFFFESLAADQRERAIGVILSGTATDGTVGLEAIKAEGGIAFAQDESAKYDSMPRSAVAAGCVDLVLSPEKIAKELTRLAKHPYLVNSACFIPDVDREAGGQMKNRVAPAGKGTSRVLASETRHPHGESSDDGDLRTVLLLLLARSGVDFSLYKPATIQRRVTRRMVLSKQNTLRGYAHFLKGNDKELDALYADVLISVTSFFRNPEAFDLLKEKIFPKILENQKRDEPIRIWTMGCSTGQEAYSIAMAFAECAEHTGHMPQFQLFATDLNNALLEKARAGLYAKSAVAGVSPDRLRRFFVEEQGGYRISKPLREMCIFARQNILSDPPFSRMDLISCRNLLIYLDANLQKRIMPAFHYALKPRGFLFLGASESIGGFGNLFEPADKKQKIFAKKSALMPTLHLPVSQSRVADKKEVLGIRPNKPPEGFHDELNTQREADRVTVNQFAPPGVLINSNLEILQFRGPTSAYLVPPTGKATFNVLKMAREGLMLPLRAAINKATKENERVRKDNVSFEDNGHARKVNIEVIPLKNLKQRCYLILFTTVEEGYHPPLPQREKKETQKRSATIATAESSRSAELERELAETRDYVQSIQEQYEAANEELQASSEEVQSANEELQSINEELETSKEELESTNEELTTVNEEMASRNLELNSLNNDLINLQTSVHTAIVVLGRDLTIRRFTPLAEKAFNLLITDLGRPFSSIRANFDFPEFENWIGDVINNVCVREQEVQDKQGQWYLLRGRPYLTLGNKVDGAVLILVDIDALKKTERELKEAHQYAQAIVEQVSPLLILDADLRVKTANHSFYEHFKVSPEQTIDRPLFELGNGQWNIPELRNLLKNILPRHQFIDRFEMKHNFEKIGPRVVLLKARRLDSQQRILLRLDDVTEQVASELHVRASEMRYRRLFESAKDGIIMLDPDTGLITEANPLMAELLGYKQEELVGKELWEIGLLKDEAASKAAFQQLKKKNFIRYEDLPLRTKDGRVVQVEFVSNLYRENDRVVIQCNIRDITERKRASDALRESEERYRNLFNSIDEGFCIVEMMFDDNEVPVDYRFLAVNPSFEKQSGLQDVIGKRARELVPGLEAYWFETFGNVALTGVPIRIVNQAKGLNGRWFDVYAFRLDGPESRKIAVLFNNITERKRIEEALARAKEQIDQHAGNLEREVADRTAKLRDSIKSLESLTYTMAHDLRAPMRAMHGLTDALAEDVPLNELGKDYASRIKVAADRMDRLINDLLEYGQLTHLAFPFHPIDLKKEIKRSLAHAAEDIDRVNAEIQIQEPLPTITANETLLDQVLSSLLGNALKFTRPGAKPKILVHAETRGHMVRLWVEDNGIGIDPQYQEKIFGVFQRLHTNEAFSGTGVGLAIVKRAVERMGGTVGLESKVGKGSKFWVELPKA